MNKNLKRKISILSIALILTSTYALSAIVTFMETDFGISRSFSESLISLPSLFILFMTLISEIITRKIGMKACVITGLFFIFVSGLLPVAFKSLYSIIVSRVLLGLGLGFFCSHSANYINLFYRDDEKEGLQGIRNSMEFTGQILLLLIAGLLIKINWIYSFLIYTLAIFILLLFYKNVEDINFDQPTNKIKINFTVLLFMAISAFCIMNITAMTIRFAPIAERNLGSDTNVSVYLALIPLVGMICGFLYGKVFLIFKENIVLLGLVIYTGANIIISFSQNHFYLYLICTLLVTIAQSMVMPYMFSNASRLVDKSSKRFATNMMFVASNLGASSAFLVINSFSNLIKTKSLSLGFLIFAIFSIFLIYFFRKYSEIKS
ncbi:MAG: MFS transporter [Peptoniphilaceae bacterium]|nr:MFS transporter [Peptoniphilaceae bacterium]MDY6018102.1 MFS transporter [Anaerococcus sp.]